MASADRPGAGGECPWMRMSPGIGLRPTPPPLFRTQGHSPPPSDLRGGRGAKDGNPTLQESGFPASLRSDVPARSEEHTSELQSLMRISYAVFCLKKKKNKRLNKT